MHGFKQQVSVHAVLGALLQHGGALVPVQCATQIGAWLLGVGAVGFAATKGTVIDRSATASNNVMAILRLTFCISLPQ